MVKFCNHKDPAVAARMMAKLRDVFDGRRFVTTPDGINSATVAAALGITKRVGVQFCEMYRRERETAERSAQATPGPANNPTPTPNATARPPTRPTHHDAPTPLTCSRFPGRLVLGVHAAVLAVV